MLRLFPLLLLTLAVVRGAPSFTIWPPAPRPPGISDAEYPVPREYGYFRLFQDTINQARTKPVDLLVDGDSLTCYWPGIARTLWGQRYGGLNVADFGNGHDRVENLLWRLNHGELEGIQPKLIVVEIGQCNIFVSPPGEIAAGIKQAVATYRQRSPASHIVVMGIFPRGTAPTDPGRALVKQVNQAIASVDDGQHVTFLDIDDKFLAPNGSLAPELGAASDFEHMSDKGFQVWMDAIQPLVDRYCAKSVPAPAVNPVTDGEPTLNWPVPEMPHGVGGTVWPTPPIYWIPIFAYNLQQLNAGPCELFFDGDSITDNWRGPGLAVWKARYGADKAVNMGIGGDLVQNVLWRTQHGELDGQDPKLIELMVGTNNHGEDPKEVAAGIRLILNEYKTRCPHAHILLLGILPAGQQPHTQQREWYPQVNRLLATFADDRVTYLDFGDQFLQPDGTMKPGLMGGDFIHPVAAGYTLWANAIQPVVDKYLPGSAAAPAGK